MAKNVHRRQTRCDSWRSPLLCLVLLPRIQCSVELESIRRERGGL
jgi:hypothetical protein